MVDHGVAVRRLRGHEGLGVGGRWGVRQELGVREEEVRAVAGVHGAAMVVDEGLFFAWRWPFGLVDDLSFARGRVWWAGRGKAQPWHLWRDGEIYV